MLRIMSDNDVVGHVSRLMDVCEAPPWAELWYDLECVLCTFEDLDLTDDVTDAVLWQACQDRGIILITGNRNADGPESLEFTIRKRNGPDSLPVLTLADPDRITHDRDYRELLIERLFDVLIDMDALRGAGRLYLP